MIWDSIQHFPMVVRGKSDGWFRRALQDTDSVSLILHARQPHKYQQLPETVGPEASSQDKTGNIKSQQGSQMIPTDWEWTICPNCPSVPTPQLPGYQGI